MSRTRPQRRTVGTATILYAVREWGTRTALVRLAEQAGAQGFADRTAERTGRVMEVAEQAIAHSGRILRDQLVYSTGQPSLICPDCGSAGSVNDGEYECGCGGFRAVVMPGEIQSAAGDSWRAAIELVWEEAAGDAAGSLQEGARLAAYEAELAAARADYERRLDALNAALLAEDYT